MEQTETKSQLTQTVNTATEIGKETLKQTQTFLTKVLDTADTIDRKFYGKRMKIFVVGSFLVLIGAPILDWFFELIIKSYPKDTLTFLSTLTFSAFLAVLFVSWISAWRDDNGNWTFKCFISRIKTYYGTLVDSFHSTRATSQEDNIYKWSLIFIVGSICWKSLQNVSVFIRKPIESIFSTKLIKFRDFEHFTNIYFWVGSAIGAIGLIYLYRKNPLILKRLQEEIKSFFFSKKSSATYNTPIKISATSEFVINAKNEQQFLILSKNNDNPVFKNFLKALQEWQPHNYYYEYDFQNALYRHLRKSLPDVSVDLEYPIKESATGIKGRADIMINESILVEMKGPASINAAAIQKAQGQFTNYTRIWKDKGPSVLLLCGYDYEHAKTHFAPTMSELEKLQRPALTIVARSKK